MTMKTYPENMNLKTAAKYLGVPAATVQRLLKNCEIPAAKIGNHWLFKKSVIDEWLVENSWASVKTRPRTNASKQPSSAAAVSKKQVHPSIAKLFAVLDNFDYSGLDPADWDNAQKLIVEERASSVQRLKAFAKSAGSSE
jgi:excisionase family DNA binding protein